MTKTPWLMLSLGVLCAGAGAQPVAMQDQAGTRWVCGGIGLAEREAFAKLEPQANLKLVFAAGKEGAYLADVGVVVSDPSGKKVPLRFTASGPICLIAAPAGSYRVEATYHDTKAVASAAVGKTAGHPGTVVLRFPEAR
jgi:hypothetical protein